MELVNALLIAANMLFGGQTATPVDGSASIYQAPSVIVIDTNEVN